MTYTSKQYAEMADYANKNDKILLIDTDNNLYLSDPEEPTLEQAKSDKIMELQDKYNFLFQEVNAIYPSIEREGWFLQREEALKVLVNNEESPLLERWVTLRQQNETVENFARLILGNYEKWSLLYSMYTPMQQYMYNQINALTNVKDILAYKIDFTI